MIYKKVRQYQSTNKGIHKDVISAPKCPINRFYCRHQRIQGNFEKLKECDHYGGVSGKGDGTILCKLVSSVRFIGDD